jgi:glutamate-1-semialdehyde 2,1-aminomutase
MAAGLAALELISAPGFYEPLFEATTRLSSGLEAAAAKAGIPFTTNHAGTMFGGFFTADKQVSNYAQVMACDTERFNRFFHGMLDAGVYLAPASYEAGFMSAAHGDAEIEQTLAAASQVFATL